MKRRYKRMSDVERANRDAFHEEGWKQRVCQKCGKGGAYESHHVVEKKKLKSMFRVDVLWDTRNCLRLCTNCHSRHTTGSQKLLLRYLTDANYVFAFEVLEGEAFYYLERHYDGKDQRLYDHQTRWEAENGYEPDAAAGSL